MEAFKHFYLHDWYFAIPMTLMSIAGFTLVVWRMLLNMNSKTDMEEFLPIFQDKLQNDGVESALRFCRSQYGIVPRKLYAAGLESSKQGVASMKRSMASVLDLEILPELNFLLAPILAIAKIATMVGLFGTVVSMINTFNAIANNPNPGEVTGQAKSIGLALFATALGLFTAIPLVFSHVLFKDWIARFETQMKASAQRLIVLFQNIKPKQGDTKPKDKDEKATEDRRRGSEPSTSKRL